MRFQDPLILGYLLLLTAAAAAFFFWAELAYRKMSERFAEKEMIPRLTSERIGKRRVIRMALDIIVVVAIGLALARPQWGQSWKQKTAEGLDILFAVDISKSMLATDVKPDRLSYAKSEIRDFIERLNGDRVGLIGFSGDAFLYCPPTAYYRGFFLALEGMRAGGAGRGGTSLESAIKEAVKAFTWAVAKEKILILITDGEETDGNAVTAAEAAKKSGVEIDTIGVGTAAGSALSFADEKGEIVAVRDEQGRAVTSKLDESLLKNIAAKTGGIYVHAGNNGFGLEKIYEERLSKLKKHQTEESLLRSYQERFGYPLAIAFIALFISTAIGMTGSYEKS